MHISRIGAVIGLAFSIGCSTDSSRAAAAATRLASTTGAAPDTVTAATPTANPVGVWRGTSLCIQRPSACKDEMVVYRIARVNGSDSLSVDGRKIVNGQEDEMGVLGCRVASETQFECPITNAVWYFNVRGDSLLAELRDRDNTLFRDVRAARSK